MTVRKPLVLVAGQINELDASDELPAAKNLNLVTGVNQSPETVAIKQNGSWVQVGWATFIGMVNSATNAAVQRFSVPLTYDEESSDGAVSLTRLGATPWITPDGMRGDGVGARYRVAGADLPGYVKTDVFGPLTLHATVRAESWRHATRDVIVSACEDDATANPKLEIAVSQDIEYTDTADIVLRSYTGSMQTKRLARIEWEYFRRFPELTKNGYAIRPQGLCFIDADTFLATAHFEEQFSMCYKIAVADGAILGSFKIGPEAGISSAHVGSIAKRADGTYWFSENTSRILYKVDLAASFAAGNMVSTGSYNVSVTVSASAIEFATIGGTEYLLIGEYLVSGTPYLYVIAGANVVDGGVFALAGRVKRFTIQQRCQGISYQNNKLYFSVNRLTADVGTASGRIYYSDIDTAVASGADGSDLAVAYFWAAPSQYPEDIDFHPVSGKLWTSTEGLTAVGSDNGFLAIWQRSLTEEKAADYATNHVTAEYDGGGGVTVKINNQLFDVLAWTPTVTPQVLSIGAPPTASAGQTNGFFVGDVRNIVLQDQPMTAAQYAVAVDGTADEANALTVYTVTVANPGAETGDATGWTVEVGGIAAKNTSSREPWGTWYFDGGSHAQSISRQRFSIATVTGLTTADIDAAATAGNLWARAGWQQRSFATGGDYGGMGLRMLNGAATQLDLQYSALIDTLPLAARWIPRSWPLRVPTSARSIDLILRADRLAGTNNDTYFDQIEFKIYKK